MARPGHPPAEPFFIEAGAGSRFCLFHPPQGQCRGGLVYLHPFGEEMNRSRRTAALASRALAAGGIGVLQLDLHGCGDSSGDFADARWETWKNDVALACAWLRARLPGPVGLWGLRLGALLALDCAHEAEWLQLWQPVTDGSAYLTQILRLRLAGELLQDDGAKASTTSLKAELRAGRALEVAGYTLAPELALAINELDAASLVPRCPAHWFEVVPAPDHGLSPAASRIVDGWRERGAAVQVELSRGQPFWATPEIAECLPLVDATVNACHEAIDA